MNRFRKRSDAKRSQVPNLQHSHEQNAQTTLPELPSSNDFRTSLILPDLSRRFSLLRSSTGDPVSLEHLRTRLASQRARGAQNQISEEEEDMLLETLGKLRSTKTPSPAASQEYVAETDDSTTVSRSSVRSTATSSSSVTSSPNSRSKRYSNNLFGSGRLRDYSYLKSVASSKNSTSSTRVVSLTPTEASTSTREASNASLRPVTPDHSIPSSSVQSTPNEDGLVRPAPHIPPAPFGDNAPVSIAEYRLQKTLGPAVLKRASMALEEAIKEIEDEVEDEILLPRSVPIPRGNLDQPTAEVQRESHASSNSALYEAAMAISIDQTIHTEFSERRQSPIPARTVPGYVPGMPRPMTPRDFDFDEQRSHSTTPRAQSPYTESSPLSNVSTSKIRRESISSITAKSTPITPVAAAPLFLQRSTNGRYTPDDSHRSGGGDSVDFDSSLNLSILGRRRPASPLSGPPYQPMTAVTNRPPSRPTTPSNVIWTPSVNNNNGHRNNRSGHSRNNSWTAEAPVLDTDYLGSDRHHKPGPRSLKSPAFPDSPTLDFSSSAPYSSTFANSLLSNGGMTPSEQPQAYIPEVELGSPILGATYIPRSVTPTQTAQRSPISPSFSNFDLSPRNGSRRSSRQNPPSSPFNIGPFPSLGLSPRANSSRSSLNSVGSSFHSWDEPDKVLSVFSDVKDQQATPWHDLDKELSSMTPGQESLGDDEWDPEEIIQRYAGLKKVDFAAVQEKLVAAAFAKLANTDPRDRAPSALRRRRPSTSQSNYRVASPPPQIQAPASPSYVVDDKLSRASALLNSVVDSIKERPSTPTVNTNASVQNSSLDDSEVSPNTRRNRDLAHVLFGTDEDVKEEAAIPEEPKPAPVFSRPTPVAVSTSESVAKLPPLVTAIPISPTKANPIQSPSFTSPYLLLRNPSTPKIPQTPQEQAELAREIQEKTDAAMIALNKNPSRTNLGDGLKHTPSVRRKVDTSQISTPTLVSTTTSVETVPLRTPSLLSNGSSGPGASKLGSRFKKLRGSLRAKNITSSDETVTPEVSKSPLASQTAFYDPAKLNPPGAPKLSSATETGRFKVPMPSPPASAGPGLKGFMARFRNKQRMSEMPSGGEHSPSESGLPLSPTSPLTPRQAEPTTPKLTTSPTDRNHTLTPRPAGQPRPMYSRFPHANPNPPAAPTPPPESTPTHEPENLSTETAQQSDAALEQFFAAATNLGLDENVINDLLARSGSTSSRNLLARNNSVAKTQSAPQKESKDDAQPVAYVASSGSDQTATPTSYVVSSEKQLPPPDIAEIRPATPEDVTVTRKRSARKTEQLRRPKEGQTDNAGNAIVRRTILIAADLSPSDFSALAALTQRKTSVRKKRASATSVSSRSVHDRAPTPPPPKSPTVKRFSADGMPPMPQMPNFVGQADKMLSAPSTSATGPIEKSNSTYDSLYDMYAGESRAASAALNDPNLLVDQAISKGEPLAASDGPALEIIQLANGETIWNIVNGLRDGDDESIYSGRASFASEYSSREPGNDGLQSFMKEHARSGSKSSVSSFVSKKKPQGKNRPETNVFYSSSAQIGRLIESLSQSADAGSFNIIPNRGPGHSTSSSLSTNDINWTVEERLEHMLGSMNNGP